MWSEEANTKAIQSAVLGYSMLRSALYTIEGLARPLAEFAATRRRPHLLFDDRELFMASRRALVELLKQDAERIAGGEYPMEVLRPENPLHHMRRIPRLFLEGMALAARRDRKETKAFSGTARELLDELPDYYQRNFHFQDNGYLSARSAELYDHQVEVLFAGAADAMRRLILVPLRRRFGFGQGEGLQFLEIGAGAGSATRFVRLAFPKAKIVAVDLSSPYLKQAQARLSHYARHDFIEADGANLPLRDETFDAVYSVFLFHELPIEAREAMVREGWRVLKTGGFYGFVDSLQLGDNEALDEPLKRFPVDFHEPFYRHYIENPMESILEEAGLTAIETATGFFSKVCTAMKP
jgi:ubiquinone/menaquinone biosynthesis C-methylase UbiE